MRHISPLKAFYRFYSTFMNSEKNYDIGVDASECLVSIDGESFDDIMRENIELWKDFKFITYTLTFNDDSKTYHVHLTKLGMTMIDMEKL